MEINGLSQFITDYIEGRRQPKLEAFDKEAEKKLAVTVEADEQARLQQQLLEQRREIEQKYEVRTWLTDAAARAGQTTLVTHGVKFTHSHAKGSNVFLEPKSKAELFLTSFSLRNPAVDAVGNAAAIDVARLLQAECEGGSLAKSLLQNDYSALATLAESPEELDQWVSGLKRALVSEELSSHKLAKQIYFPISEKGEYHVISPLYSSSLSDALYQRIHLSRFSEASKQLRKDRKDNHWSADKLISYSDIAIQKMGGTKPQVVSNLNLVRGGKSYLLRCAPPEWQSVTKPPVEQKTIFGATVGKLAGGSIWQLHQYLVSVAELENTRHIRQKREELVDEIIGVVFSYAAEIQNLPHQTGWSKRAECQLKVSQQLWLDPLRQEDDLPFKRLREDTDSWQKEIAADFGHWLNTRLNRSEKLNMGAVEVRELASALLRRRLFEFDACRQEVMP